MAYVKFVVKTFFLSGYVESSLFALPFWLRQTAYPVRAIKKNRAGKST